MIPMEGGGYTAPGIEDFQFTGLFGTDWITKPMVQAVIAAYECGLVTPGSGAAQPSD